MSNKIFVFSITRFFFLLFIVFFFFCLKPIRVVEVPLYTRNFCFKKNKYLTRKPDFHVEETCLFFRGFCPFHRRISNSAYPKSLARTTNEPMEICILVVASKTINIYFTIFFLKPCTSNGRTRTK